jgi:tetratricopeptide (TPR) repeat protein
MAARFGWNDNPGRSVEIGEDCAARVIAAEPTIPDAHSLAGGVALAKGDYDRAIEAGRRSIELGPNHPDCLHTFAMTQCFAGNPRAAVDLELQPLRLNPLSPVNSLVELGRAYFHLGRYDEAKDVLRQVSKRQPRWLAGHTLLVAACVASGGAAEVSR